MSEAEEQRDVPPFIESTNFNCVHVFEREDILMSERRKPWLAALLSLLLPGLGQLYCARLGRAVLMVMGSVVIYNVAMAILVFSDLNPFNVALPGLMTLAYLLVVMVDAYRIAKQCGDNVSKRPYNRWYLYVLLVVGWNCLTSYWFLFSDYQAYSMPAFSMEDSIMVGDYILVDCSAYDSAAPEINDIVVFVFPRDGVTKYIKRCVAGPGDNVLVQDKVLYVNNTMIESSPNVKYTDVDGSGNPLVQPRKEGGLDSRDNFGPYMVPSDSYFILGDNRDNSFDSRYWGPVPDSLILGKVVRIHWSADWRRIGISVL